MVFYYSYRLFLTYLGIKDLPSHLQKIVQKYYFLSALTHASIMISSTFYILYVLSIVGFAKLGLLLSIGFVFQAIVDFPTAIIADWIGYKWVLTTSYILHSIAFFLLGFIGFIKIPFAFPYLVAVFIIESLALAQESGALQAWFDNNYKQVIEDKDPDLETYRGVFGKTLLAIRGLGGIAIYIGGFIAGILNREMVFFLQGGIMAFLAFTFIFTVQDFTHFKSSVSLKDFVKNLFLGFKLIFRSRNMLFFQIAYIITIITNLIWINLIIYPLYFGYSGSDTYAATLRSVIFLVGGIMTMIGVGASKKIKMKKWLPVVVLLYALGYYGGFAFLLIIYPLTNTLNLTAIYIMFILAIFGMLINTIWLLLLQKLMLVIIPDENRNAFYSLSPTLSLLIGSVFAYLIGKIIEELDTLSKFSPISSDPFVITILLFLVIPTGIAAFTLFVSLRDFSPTDEIIDPNFHIYALDNILFGPESSIDISKISTDLRIEIEAKKMIHKLLQTAVEDGKITEDEHILLSQIVSNFKQYIQLLEDAKDDGVIDQTEKQLLLKGRDKILDDAYNLASVDNVITEDEYAILNKLTSIVRELEAIED